MPNFICRCGTSMRTVVVAGGSTVYVPRGATLHVKAQAGPGVAVPELSQTFTTVSGSATQTFAAPGNSVQVVVYELTLVSTPLDDFTGRSQTDLGVDEGVNLSVTILPVGLTAAQIGLRWKLEGASGESLHGNLYKSSSSKANAGTDGLAHYRAPVKTIKDTYLFASGATNPAAASLTKSILLKLVVSAGPCEGHEWEKRFTIHTPTAVMTMETGREYHMHDMPSAGFIGIIHLRPLNVSFRTLEWREAGGVAKAYETADARRRPGGYFAYDHGKVHHVTGTAAAANQSRGETRSIGGGNITTGCKILQYDTVRSGWNTDYPNASTDPRFPGISTTTPSVVEWPIYWQYRVARSAGTWVTFQKAVHRSEVDAAGAVTISKAGASLTKALADASVWTA